MLQATLRPLQRAQNAAARLVANMGSRDHITPAMKELHWLPINQRITYKLCLMMHFIHTQQYPDYMRDLVSMTATTATRTGLRSASGLSYWKPRIRTKFGERAFSYSGLAAWNSRFMVTCPGVHLSGGSVVRGFSCPGKIVCIVRVE